MLVMTMMMMMMMVMMMVVVMEMMMMISITAWPVVRVRCLRGLGLVGIFLRN